MTAFIFVMIFIVILCFLLVMLVLSQNPKGGGLSGTFGGGGSAQMFGVQKTNDFLDKATWTLAISIAVLIVFSFVLVPKRNATFDINNNQAPQEQTQPKAPSNNTAPATPPPAPNGNPLQNEK